MNCQCDGHYTTNWHRWRVLQRSESTEQRSLLYCLQCRIEWRSKARYVVLLRDHKKESRPTFTDTEVLQLLDEGRFVVDTMKATVISRQGKLLAVESRTHKDGENRGTYRFVNLCSGKGKRKIALHKLVWMAQFRELVPPGKQVDHKVSQLDDTIPNLQLLDAAENSRKGNSGAMQETSEAPF